MATPMVGWLEKGREDGGVQRGLADGTGWVICQ